VENYSKLGQPQIIRHVRIACCMPKSMRIFRLSNIHCFTTTMVARTCLNVTSYIACLVLSYFIHILVFRKGGSFRYLIHQSFKLINLSIYLYNHCTYYSKLKIKSHIFLFRRKHFVSFFLHISI
jgi:hypothetical protein